MTDVIQILILVILLFLSAFFSSAETALTTVSRIKMRTLADNGNKRARKVLKVTDDKNKMLSAILIGNNIVNLSASSLATTIAVKMLGSYGAGIATGILTLLILIFGEISPKTMASIRATQFSLRVAGIIWTLMNVLTPVIVVVNQLSRIVIRLFRVDPNAKPEALTEEELRTIVDVSHENGVIEQDEKKYIHNLFDFSDATAHEVMIPRIDMTMINVTWSYEKLLEVFQQEMLTRMPVYEGDTDHIIGIINMKDLLLPKKQKSFTIRDYLRDAYFTYEQKNASELFQEMREKSQPMAIVLDEYGAVAGLVTLEDLLEELVGEIRDEYDQDEEDDIVPTDEEPHQEFDVLGSMNLEDLCNILPLGFESEDYDTIGGYLTGEFDHFPEEGETYVSSAGVIVRVAEVGRNRIEKVHIRFPESLEDFVARQQKELEEE